jgi:RNA 2',3'-cyclic 3'-phosphodiesterase
VRLFVAVWPPPEVIELISQMPRPELGSVRWTTSEQWHVTLRFFGEVADVDQVAEALHGLSGAAEAVASLGPQTAWFPGRRVLQVPVAGLEELERDVARVTSTIPRRPRNSGSEAGKFHGHLTLARARGRTRVEAKDAEAVAGFALDAMWRVGSVSLVSSVRGHEGSRYSDVTSVSLGGSPDLG